MIELYERDALMDKNKTSLQMSVFIDERINLLNKDKLTTLLKLQKLSNKKTFLTLRLKL